MNFLVEFYAFVFSVKRTWRQCFFVLYYACWHVVLLTVSKILTFKLIFSQNHQYFSSNPLIYWSWLNKPRFKWFYSSSSNRSGGLNIKFNVYISLKRRYICSWIERLMINNHIMTKKMWHSTECLPMSQTADKCFSVNFC